LPEEFKHIVRMAGTNLEGSDKLGYGLAKIKGVSINLAEAVIKVAELDPSMRVGNLNEKELTRIEEVLRDPSKHGIPPWLLNYRKESQTGNSLHLIGSDLMFRVKSDIDFMKKLKTWKGVRHSLGLKVRGQRTKTTARKGRVVGVAKKAILLEAERAEEKR